MKFDLPPHQKNENGETRKIGFEIEFAGVEIEQVAKFIATTFGGEHVRESRFFHKVTDTAIGDFKVEMDAAILKDKLYEKYLKKLGIDLGGLLESVGLEDALAKIASTVVPFELAIPPIPLTELHEVEKIRAGLQKSKARGTEASLVYAFGLHINPETPARDVQTLLNFMRAFLLLYIWIFKKSEIDLSRRLTPFIDEFPEDYVRLILEPAYAPDFEKLVADYLEHNPTRNRPLDMLPLFADIDESIMERLEWEIVRPRPTFHYRLPNCLVDDPEWQISSEWNYWVEVERLADAPDAISELSAEYLTTLDATFLSFKNKWFEKIDAWLQNQDRS